MDNEKNLEQLIECFKSQMSWRDSFPSFETDETLEIPEEKVKSVFEEYFKRLLKSYPFFHRNYAGQMLKPPHPVSALAYFTAMLINPNNHALDGGPETSEMEKEAVHELAGMLGFKEYLGHLTSSGTIANLEALWISRSTAPDKFIAFSRESHYTHRRMCEVIGAKFIEIDVDSCGKIDISDLKEKLERYPVGTVVATAGTTGRGAVDPIHRLVELKEEHNFRLHIDAAYGGYFVLLAAGNVKLVEPEPFLSISQCDSVVVDPHKHGLQPYGCGSIIFKEPSVGKFYKHDSPYTYFTSKELHLGEISLECSRAGAAAAALWLTLKCFPLKPDEGMGKILAKTRKAALKWAELLNQSKYFDILSPPDLDIVVFFPRPKDLKASLISELSEQLFNSAMNNRNFPVYLAKMNLTSEDIQKNVPELTADREYTTLLRSCLMKPEHLSFVPELHNYLENLLKLIRK